MKIRIREFIHPDSFGVTCYEVEQLTEANGKYSKKGDTYWRSLTLEPFTSKSDAEVFMGNHAASLTEKPEGV